ncbi:glycosyltransferase family 2 protein [Chitinophagaceae bacterium LB-8]|uniref:Glycosyltransferase family 2 protein n=1 Tax=Paraflavisolibacter caeni TaxID=2982496 RepID=A0A9X2XXG5_9BACT|nr:glycosyltransferase family 2 protein [Paraflavisolibacter caeni]MCU7550352.1 glycosyltransferase family 2 protein [Paraflavisolibacter caeni]
MKLSIIIINYKSAHHVLNCIESVYKETARHTFEIIVVDNNSGDDSEEKIRSAFPGIIWLQTGYNAGFARANNEGIKIAKGENILLLNADTIVQGGALDKTIDLFEQDQEAVACGVQLLNPDGTHQISGAHFIKGSLNFLLPLPYLGRFIRYMGYRLGSKVPSVQTVSDKVEVDWVVGAFLMVRRDVLPSSGLLDSDFFMYAEEIEWCSRLRKNGKLYLYEEPKVIHLGGGTSGDYYETEENENSKNLWNKKGRQILVSQFVRVRKQHGILWFLIIWAIFIFEIPIFIFGLLLEKILKGGKSRFSWQNVGGYIQNMVILMRYFFRILLNKPFFYKVY